MGMQRRSWFFGSTTQNIYQHPVGWVAFFNPTNPNANTFYGIATPSLLG
jgi:hypothetical protein